MPEIPFTYDDDANRLLGENTMALLVGLTLYQQVPIEKAFGSPLELQRRLGAPLSAHLIADTDADRLEEVFRDKPALHRFPANMAKRTAAVADHIVDTYDGDPAAIWTGVADSIEVMKRLEALPGFGEYKATVAFTILVKRYGVQPAGWQELIADFPTVADIDSTSDIEAFKVRKKEWKAASGG
jgi:uncharacterized HhH-GPD family protein